MCGMPASGKTTYAEKLINKSGKQKKYIDFIKKDQNTFFGKVLHTIFYLFLTDNNIFYLNLKKELKEYVYDRKVKYSKEHTVEWFAKRITYLYFIYDQAKKLKINLIVTEGVSQQLITFAVEYGIEDESFVKLYKSILKDRRNFQIYTFNATIEETTESFVRRDRHVTPIDELREDDLSIFLNEYNKYLSIINTFAFAKKINR